MDDASAIDVERDGFRQFSLVRALGALIVLFAVSACALAGQYTVSY